MDYLKPYLARIGDPQELSKVDANKLQYECLHDYKQLLIRRANKILHEFEERSQDLMKLQAIITQVG